MTKLSLRGLGQSGHHSQLQYDLTAVLESSPAPGSSRTIRCSEDKAPILLIGLSPTLLKVLMGRQSHKLKGPDFALSYPCQLSNSYCIIQGRKRTYFL